MVLALLRALCDQQGQTVTSPDGIKRPRQHAAELLDLSTPAARHAALVAIQDANTRAVVRFYVEDAFARRRHTRLPDFASIRSLEHGRT
jgi:hypothetical protein